MAVDPSIGMTLAINHARLSVDPSVQNGAVICTVDGQWAGGFNGQRLHPHQAPERWERPDKYLWVEHAERAAIYQAAKDGLVLRGATMWCPWAACADCARAISYTGIKRLIRFPMGSTEGWDQSVEVGDMILSEAGVEIVELVLADYKIPAHLRLGQYR